MFFKKISIFQKLSVVDDFSSKNEKSLMHQEFKIFASLPIVPILKALYLYLKKESWLRYINALLIVVAYQLLSKFIHQLAAYFSYLVLIIGLLWIGIPHGALDNMLSKNINTPVSIFIFKYLLFIGLYYIFWHFFPLAGLLVFIIFSAFHFGESELVETEGEVDTPGAYLKSFLMGLSILLSIILGHPVEALGIVANFIAIPVLSYAELNFAFIAMCGAILSFVYILMQSILSKRWSYLGLMFLLVLGVKVPLILAFGIYFVFQHSSNAWQHLKLKLNMNSIQLYRKSSFYTLGALAIFLLIAFYPKEIVSMDGLWANFYIFIVCISFPHFFLMHIFYKTRIHQNL